MTVTAPPRPPRPSDPVDPRGAGGPRRGTVRGGAAARTPPPSHLRGFRGARGAGRGRVSRPFRPLGTAGHRFPCARRTIQWSGRSGEVEDRLHPRASPCGLCGVLWVMNADGSGQRKLTAHRWDALVARWSEDRLRGHRRPADVLGERRLRHERGRERQAADEHATRKAVCLVARRTEDRLRPWLRAGSRSLRHERRRERPAEADEARQAANLPGRRREKIAFIEPPRRQRHHREIYVMNADGSQQRRLTRNTVGDRTPSGRPTVEGSPSEATGRSTS